MEINKKTIQSRVRNGWSLEKAMNTPKLHTTFLKDKCKEYNIPYATVYTRMNEKHLTLEEALNKPKYKYIWNGQPVHTLLSPLEYKRFRMRIKLGWSIEEAILTPAFKRGKHKEKMK